MTESSQTYKEVIDITKDAVSGVMPYFEKIAEQMGTTAQYLWMLQIKQGYILAATMLSKWLFLLGIFIFCIYICNKYSGIKDAEEVWGISAFVAVLLFLVLTFSFFSNIQLVLTLLFNTDYWAIQQLILLIKGSITF